MKLKLKQYSMLLLSLAFTWLRDKFEGPEDEGWRRATKRRKVYQYNK